MTGTANTSGGTTAGSTAAGVKPTDTPEYKGLQQTVNLKEERIKTLEAELEEAKKAGEETISLREELNKAKTSIAVSEAKATYPQIADMIDDFIEEYGKLPSNEKMKKWAEQLADRKVPESSGIKNSPARKTTSEEDKATSILKNSKMWD